MRRYLLLAIMVCSVSSTAIAQEQELPQEPEIERKFKLVFRQSAGIFIGHPSEGINATLNTQLQTKKLFGFGLDLTNGIYESPNLNVNPGANEIANYDPATDGPIPELLINGSEKDKFWGISAFISKGFDVNEHIAFEFQGGPSLALIKKRTFTYTYSEASGSFGPYVIANSFGSTETAFGGYLRAYASLKIGKVFLVELSPYANFNNIENELGAQLGLGFKI